MTKLISQKLTKQARKLKREIKQDHRPDYYEVRALYDDDSAKKAAHKKHGTAKVHAGRLSREPETIKVRIFWFKYGMGLIKTEYIKGDRLN